MQKPRQKDPDTRLKQIRLAENPPRQQTASTWRLHDGAVAEGGDFQCRMTKPRVARSRGSTQCCSVGFQTRCLCWLSCWQLSLRVLCCLDRH